MRTRIFPLLQILPICLLAFAAATAAAEAPAPRLDPVYLEISSVLQEQQDRLQELYARAAEPGDETGILALQREVEQVKMETEVELFRIQLRLAEKRGDVREMELLDAAIESIRARMPVKPEPTVR